MAIAKHFANRYRIIKIIRSLVAWATLLYFRFFAKIALHNTKATSIGIAGAVGKSTTRDALAAILTPYANTLVIKGNSETGIPLGILGLEPGNYGVKDWILNMIIAPTRIFTLKKTNFIIVEMGIDGPFPPKNMEYLLTVVKPHIGILLSESPAHVEHYEQIVPKNITSKEDQLEYIVSHILQDDAKLLQTSSFKTAIVDATDNRVFEEAKKRITNTRLYTVGSTSEHDLIVHSYELSLQGTTFGFSLHTHQQKEYLTISFPGYAFPKATGASIAAAILTCVHLDVPLSLIQELLSTGFSPPKGRCTILSGKNNSTIIDSSYNSSPSSMESFLTLLKTLKQSKKPTVFVFGDMKELGSFSQLEHSRIARQCIGVVDHLLLIGPLTKQYVIPTLEKHINKFRSVLWFSSLLEAAHYLSEHIPQDAIMVCKGSQNLEELIKPLLVHKTDTNKLCRQEEFWEKSKKARNVWIESI